MGGILVFELKEYFINFWLANDLGCQLPAYSRLFLHIYSMLSLNKIIVVIFLLQYFLYFFILKFKTIIQYVVMNKVYNITFVIIFYIFSIVS